MLLRDWIVARSRKTRGRVICLAGIFSMVFAPSLTAEITVVQLANEGVMVSAADTRVIIGGMVVEKYAVYGGLEGEALQHFNQLSGPFADIDLVLASHRHHDHNQPEFACQFMQASQARMLSSPQVLGLMRERCRDFVTSSPRITEITPDHDNPYLLEHEALELKVFPLSHGTRKYARIQNYAHLLKLGDLKILHIGDAAMDPVDFGKAGLQDESVDVALIPFWFFQPGPGWEIVKAFMDAPVKVAVHIPPSEVAEVTEYMAAEYPEVIVLAQPLSEARFVIQPAEQSRKKRKEKPRRSIRSIVTPAEVPKSL